MTRIKILKSGLYRNYDRRSGLGAQFLSAGDAVGYPDDYARYLIEAGSAEPVEPLTAEPAANVSMATEPAKPAEPLAAEPAKPVEPLAVPSDEAGTGQETPVAEPVAEPVKRSARAKKAE